MEELDLRELFSMFWSMKIYILLIVLIFMVVGIIYTCFFVTPKYKASTTLLLTTSQDEKAGAASTITTTDISINNNLVATYSELIKSKNIIREVIDTLKLSDSEDAIRGSISVSSVKSTQMIQLDVVDLDSKKAQVIANEVAKVFSKKVEEFYNINNVQVVDVAEEPTNPYNVSHIKDVIIFAAVGFVVSAGYVLIANMLDTTVKSEEDIKRKTGLTVLVSIPSCNFDELPKTMKKGGRK